jgi:putative SOS response-associated peptidase YedK
MCGRYRLSRRKQLVAEYFESTSWEEDWIPRYNIAPTQPIPVIRQNAKEPVRELSVMKWGLVPSWAIKSRRFALSQFFPACLCFHAPLWGVASEFVGNLVSR